MPSGHPSDPGGRHKGSPGISEVWRNLLSPPAFPPHCPTPAAFLGLSYHGWRQSPGEMFG